MSELSTPKPAAERAQRALLIAVGITIALYVVPYGNIVGYPLILFSTFVHEMGHGIAGWMVGREFVSFEMFANASGVAHTAGNSGRLASAFVAFGGLVGPAIVAAVFFVVARWTRASRVALGVFGVSMLVLDLLLVRNVFGFAFVAALGVALAAVGLKAKAETAQFVVVFLAVQLGLTVFSRGDYLFTEFATVDGKQMPSDVGRIAEYLFLPYWFWGALIAVFSVAVLGIGAFTFLRRLKNS